MWIGIARVKNEADLIEAFVRHTCCHFDRLIIIDHASTDDTPAILTSLVDEGLPLEVQRSSVFEPQGVALTRLMRRAFSDLDADWVVPLDADEFIEVAGGELLRERKQVSGTGTLELFWENFMYVPGSADDLDPTQRMLWRSPDRSELPKVAVPRAIGVDPKIVIYEGSHFVARNGAIVRGRPAQDLVLCHFPIRSLDQYRSKVIIGTLRYIISPSSDKYTWGWHYRQAYDLIINDRLAELEDLLRVESLRYSAKGGSEGISERPFKRLGGELRYTSRASSPSSIANVARFAESVAVDLAAERRPKHWPARFSEIVRSIVGSKR